MTTTAFAHRGLLGWISEFVNRPLPGIWPQAPLDDETLADLDAYGAMAQECGYNEIILWGLFADRRWPVDIVSCADADRARRIARAIEAAHARGHKALSGLGLYSWGFEAIIEAYPELSRTNPRAMCPSMPASHTWMERVIDFILDNFDLDGFNMQSADQGRCTCPECSRISTAEYHARLNVETAQYIRSKWPGKILMMDNWGNPLSDPANVTLLAEAGKELDVIIDTDNSAEQAGRAYRKTLIEALPCAYGTLAGCSIWPPQNWPRNQWFIPITMANADYIRDLHADGGRAAEQFVTTLANPSGEISLRFMGRLLADPTADPHALLREVIAQVYEPSDAATLDGLTELMLAAERAYFAHVNPAGATQVGLLYINPGLYYDVASTEATYLVQLPAERRAAYGGSIAGLAQEFARLRPGIRRHGVAERTADCLQTVAAAAGR